MADEQSIQLLAFNFGSRTIAYLRLAQGLNRSLSAFNSTIREYLDALVKADKCAQYVDDIGIAANNVDELIISIEAVFQQMQKAGLNCRCPNAPLATQRSSSWVEASLPKGWHHLRTRSTNSSTT